MNELNARYRTLSKFYEFAKAIKLDKHGLDLTDNSNVELLRAIYDCEFGIPGEYAKEIHELLSSHTLVDGEVRENQWLPTEEQAMIMYGEDEMIEHGIMFIGTYGNRIQM